MHMGQINRYTYGTDIHTYETYIHTDNHMEHADTHMGQIYTQTHIWGRGTDIQTDSHMGQTYRQTHIWDRHTVRHKYGTDIKTDTNGLQKTVFMLETFLFLLRSLV